MCIRDREATSALRLKFPPSPRSGSYPVIAQEVSKHYGTHESFNKATFTIERGEKVAFVARNGEGKSTLVKCRKRATSMITQKVDKIAQELEQNVSEQQENKVSPQEKV